MALFQQQHTIDSFSVTGLFGYTTHSIRLNDKTPTILTAPNGAGKTHLLSLLYATLTGDCAILSRVNFKTTTVRFSDGSGIAVVRNAVDGFDFKVTIAPFDCSGKSRHRRVSEIPLSFTLAEVESFDNRIPRYLRRLNSEKWLDMRSDRTISREVVVRRWGAQNPVDGRLPDHPVLLGLIQRSSPVFIDTKRLDSPVVPADRSDRYSAISSPKEPQAAAARIHMYLQQLKAEVATARQLSVRETQSADVSFAARALRAAKATVREDQLHVRYNTTVKLYENLARNALAVGEAPIDFPPDTTPTIRRILSVFLDDWDKRLAPLLPLNEKITLLRDILDSKLKPSGKSTSMSQSGILEFRTNIGRRIRVDTLSSGEQHLIALFTMLLFSSRQGSLILIDEPEISLHAAWKHAFLGDISRIAQASHLQIVLATHSSAIINGRWDLTQELKLTPEPQLAEAACEETLEEESDGFDE